MKLFKTALLSFLALFFFSLAYVLIFEDIDSVTDPGTKNKTGPSQFVTEQHNKNTTLFLSAQNKTLNWYKHLDKKDRQQLIAVMVVENGIDTNQSKYYYNMMGDMAYNKSETLKFKEVFNWCIDEARRKPKQFKSHFNELDAKDLSIQAVVACRDAIKKSLISPSTADFSFDKKVFKRGKNRYVVNQNVDSQNQFGAMIRSYWHCKTVYNSGNINDVLNWSSEVSLLK